MARRNLRTHGLNIEPLETRHMLACDILPMGVEPLAMQALNRNVRLPFDDLAGSSIDTAYDLGTIDGQRTLQGRVGWQDRSDVLEFHLQDPAQVDIAISELFGAVDWRLLDASGAVLFDSSTSGDAAQLDLAADRYFIEVTPGWFFLSRYRVAIDATPTATVPAPPQSPTPTLTPLPSDPTTTSPLNEVAYFGSAVDWNLNAINAPESWAQGITGSDITVAVIDTGVDTRHPDLNENIWFNSDEIPGDGRDNDGNGFVDDVQGWNFVENNANVFDTQGHGTHVAGTVAAEFDGRGATGVAYDATIMPIRVLGDDGSGSTLDIAAGIRYAVDNGADVINLSLGGGYSSSIYAALQYAGQQDVFVAIAAGNSGESIPAYPAIHSGTLDNVISVGAYDRGSTAARFSNDAGGVAVQVDAPGVDIYSTLPGNRYGRYSGTSMAAPHVAGLAALALSADPNLSASDVKDLLVAGATTNITASSSQGVNAAYTVAYAMAGDRTSLGLAGTTTNGGTSNVDNSTTTLPQSVAQAPLRLDMSSLDQRLRRDRPQVEIPVAEVEPTTSDVVLAAWTA